MVGRLKEREGGGRARNRTWVAKTEEKKDPFSSVDPKDDDLYFPPLSQPAAQPSPSFLPRYLAIGGRRGRKPISSPPILPFIPPPPLFSFLPFIEWDTS